MPDQYKLSRNSAGPLETLGLQDAWQTTDGQSKPEPETTAFLFRSQRGMQVNKELSYRARGFGRANEVKKAPAPQYPIVDDERAFSRNDNQRQEGAEHDPGIVGRASSGSRRLLPIFGVLAAITFGSAAIATSAYILKFRADWYVSISFGPNVAYFEQKCAVLAFEARAFSATSTLDYLASNNCPAVEAQAQTRAANPSRRHPSMSGPRNSHTLSENQSDTLVQAP